MSDAHKGTMAALGRIPSGIFIITVPHTVGATGMLASWVQQCAFEPPLISLALQRSRPVAQLLTDGATLTLNILEASQTDMIAHFGKGFALEEDAFQGIDVRHQAGKGPILVEALAYLECRVQHRCQAGDHDLLIAHVVDGAVLDDGRPMTHVRKNGSHY